MPVKDGFDLQSYLTREKVRVDKALGRFLPLEKTPPSVLRKSMRYSVFAGGKRLRPILCLAAAEICGGETENVFPAACALELIHTYSLIHDDLPAMDDDDLRRGRPTNHVVFGEGAAILAGDALLTRAFELLASNAHVSGVKPWAALRAVEIVAEAAGSSGMVGGQAVDLEMEGKASRLNGDRPKVLNYIHAHKTGALIRASLKTGAVLADATEKQIEALDVYGENIGLAFQITDDILDIVGDKKLLGKRGSDRDNDKLTYPSVYGLEASRLKARSAVEAAKKALEIFGEKSRRLSRLADFMIQREN